MTLEKDKNSLTNKNKLLRFGIILSILLLLFAAELVFDIFEIAMGKILLFTNPIRPQTGRLWVEDHKEQKGIEELNANVEPQQSRTVNQPVQSLDDLQAILSMRNSLNMDKDTFKEFYRSIPVRQAKEIMDPLDLIELDRNDEWQTIQISLSGNQLVFYFLDGYERPLKESHFYVNGENKSDQQFTLSNLRTDERFLGRFVPAKVFYQAFDQLPRTYRLQIVNDPYKLVQWGSSLQRVGISSVVERDGVQIVFEVVDDMGPNLQSMRASEIAVEYLIKEINQMNGAPQLQVPERRDE